MMGEGGWSLEGSWRQLELDAATPTRGEFRVYDTGLRTVDGIVLLALDASGLRHLLVPVAAGFPPANDRRSGGVHLVTRTLLDDLGQRQYLDLACQKAHLHSVFVHLAQEVLNLLRDGAIPPLQACHQTLQRWREFLDREALNVLSTEGVCGLFGELWHMERIAAKSPLGLSAWQGPYGARHDFTTAGCALEVKTTVRRDEWKFRVHGLKQLEQPRDARLYLSAMRLELNSASGATVPELIQMLLDVGIDRRELLERLFQVGYDLRDEAHYQQIRIDVVDSRLYEVDASFPRLTSASFSAPGLAAGVSDVHYTIDLAASPSAPLNSELLDGLHGVFAGVRDADAAKSAV